MLDMRLTLAVGATIGGLCLAVSAPRAFAQTAQMAHAEQDPAAPYTHYVTPGECARVSPRRDRLLWRDQRPDTVYHPPMGDLPLRQTVASVRACLARFASSTIAQRDLLGLGKAQLAAEQPAEAEATFQRWLGRLANASTYERAWALSQIVAAYAGTTGQMPAALTYIKQLDALGDVAAPERLLAYLAVVNRAQFADSLALLDSAVAGAMRASRAMTGDTAKRYAPVSAAAYLAQANLQGRRHDGAGAVKTIEQGRNTLVPLRPSVAQAFAGAEGPYQMLGTPSPVVQASKWFTVDGSTAQRPTKGKPTLIVFAYATCGGGCYPGYAVLRRLVSRYASAGLEVVFASRTMGHTEHKLVPPDSEVDIIHHYFVDTLRLPPLTLAVWKTAFGKRPSDGHLLVQSAPNEAAFHPNLSVPLPCVLVDKQGMIQAITSVGPANEAFLDHQLSAIH